MTEYLEKKADKFTFRVAKDRLYGKDGVWVLALQADRPGLVRIGLTDFLQQHSGDAAFVSVQPVGTRLAAGDDLAELETVKATLGLPSPVSGTIVEINPALDSTPEVVNQDPYGAGWLAVVQAASWDSERPKLLAPDAYYAVMESLVDQELKAP